VPRDPPIAVSRLPRISPDGYRRITAVAVFALAAIVVTGGAVRLTGSGLGCPQWPNCDTASLSPHGNSDYHGWIEFVNRVFTGFVSLAVVVAVLGSLLRTPRRRDLTWLSIGLVVGVAAQIVLGGLTVVYGLSPPWVMAHFLVSMVLIADAVVLHARAGRPDGIAVVPLVSSRMLTMGRTVIVLTAVVLATGTIVTGAGPHGGDEHVTRLDFSVSTVARVHGLAENVFLLAVLIAFWLLRAERAPRSVFRSGQVLLVVLVAQAVVGYVQYATGVPVVLVAVHIAGAVIVWIASLSFALSMRGASGPPP
jgi:cytochrome c oxidase assembly protein subunit 15